MLRRCSVLPSSSRSLCLALLALCAAPLAPAQLKWTAYDPRTGAVLKGTAFEQAATFDAAANSYQFTIPAKSAVTLVTTNFLPIDLVAPTSSSQAHTLSFQMMTSAGGFSTPSKYANFGLFSAPAGSVPDATSNRATALSGIWVAAINNGKTTYQTKPAAAPNPVGLNFAKPVDHRLASPNVSQKDEGFGLGTSRFPGVGLIADETLYDVTFRVRVNREGTVQLGSAATPESAAGAVWKDAETGGTKFRQAVYGSATQSGFKAPAALNVFAYYFENGSAEPVRLTLGNFRGQTVAGEEFPFGPAVITRQPPATSSGVAGSTLSIPASVLAAAARGGPVTTYQWEFSRDGKQFTAVDANANPSAATPTLVLGDLQAGHAGVYRLRVATAATGRLSGRTELVSHSEASRVTVEAAPAR